MPRKRANKRTNPRRRRTRNSYKTRNRKYAMQVGPAGIPANYFTKLKWCNDITVTAAAVTGSNVFKINSALDPDDSGSGTSAQLYSTLIGIWQRCRVYAVDYNILVTQNTGTAPTYIGFVIHTTAAPAWGSINNIGTQRGAKIMILDPDNGQGISFKGHINITDYMAVKGSDTEMSSTSAADPTLDLFASVFVESVDGSTACSVQALVTLTFYCKFWDPLPLNQ